MQHTITQYFFSSFRYFVAILAFGLATVSQFVLAQATHPAETTQPTTRITIQVGVPVRIEICQPQKEGWAWRSHAVVEKNISMDLPTGTHWRIAIQNGNPLANISQEDQRSFLGLALYQASMADIPLVGNMTQLDNLHLSGSQLTDDSFTHLRNLTRLQYLSLRTCPQITGKKMGQLAAMKDLIYLDLSETGLTDEALGSMPVFDRLETLELRGDLQITGSTMSRLARCQNLKYLGMNTTSVSDTGMKPVGRLSQLRRLDLGQTKVTDKGIQQLSGLKKLQSLVLGENQSVTDVSMPVIGQFNGLVHLNLNYNRSITDQGIAKLVKLSHLQSLHLEGCDKLTGQSLTTIGQFQDLKTIDLSYCLGIDDQGLAKLAALKQLKWIDLTDCKKVTDKGIASLGQMPQLENLLLAGTSVTGVGLKHLENSSTLQNINLYHCPVNDDGLETIGKLTTLHSLVLSSTSITDASLEHLKSLKNLKDLSLAECPKITPAGLASIRKAIPNCNVILR